MTEVWHFNVPQIAADLRRTAGQVEQEARHSLRNGDGEQFDALMRQARHLRELAASFDPAPFTEEEVSHV